MIRKRLYGFLLLLATAAMLAQPCVSLADNLSKLDDAANVLREIQSIPERGIPPQLFRNAYGIAIIPGLIKAGFIVGGRFGTGVLAVREGGHWSDPVFISMSGGSVGFQIGAESTDIILVFKSQRGVQAFKQGKFTLGADASVAAGPVGRHAEAATDLQLKSEIYSYSRSRGVFGGVAIEGAALAVDNDSNAAFYHRPVTADEVFAGKVKSPPAAAKFRQMVQKYSGGKSSK